MDCSQTLMAHISSALWHAAPVWHNMAVFQLTTSEQRNMPRFKHWLPGHLGPVGWGTVPGVLSLLNGTGDLSFSGCIITGCHRDERGLETAEATFPWQGQELPGPRTAQSFSFFKPIFIWSWRLISWQSLNGQRESGCGQLKLWTDIRESFWW